MSTVKLFQQNVYLQAFEGMITSIKRLENVIILTLDKTAFFPHGGGQSCDIGFLGGLPVSDVREENDEIFHYISLSDDKTFEYDLNDTIKGEIDWAHRFDNMQRHCGEHILSGVFFREYGGVNRGFHMGEDYMTVDISLEADPKFTEVTWEMAKHIELCTNEIIWSDTPVVTRFFSTRSEAENLALRKALTLEKDITIVSIGSTESPADCVACCGTHPSSTGQVGLLKIYKVEPNKGMFRIYFEAGKRALKDYDKKHALLTSLCTHYSADINNLMEKINIHEEKQKEVRSDFFALRQSVINKKADEIKDQVSDGNVHIYNFPELKVDDLRNLSKSLDFSNCKLVIFCDEKSCTTLLYSSGQVDCNKLVKDNASVFNGKGGGRLDNAQAKFPSLEDMTLFADATEKILK